MALLCKCGFYINENSGGMCSQCYKKHIKEAIDNDLLNLFKNLKIESKDESQELKPKCEEKKLRCGVWRKKVGLSPIVCRCGHAFCAHHRYPNEHNCSFDYKTHGRKLIEKNNPKIQVDKIIKIFS